MNAGGESSIGIILCAEKDQKTVSLLELDKSGIYVAQYLTQLPPKEEFTQGDRKHMKESWWRFCSALLKTNSAMAKVYKEDNGHMKG